MFTDESYEADVRASVMTCYVLHPEVAGGTGPGTEWDRSVSPPEVKKLEYVFSGWSGSDLVTSFPCFIVSERLARALNESDFTGFQLDDVQISVDGQFAEFFPEDAARLPSWKWLRLMSREEASDFWMNQRTELHVSVRAMHFLESFDLSDCEYVEVVHPDSPGGV